MSIHDELENYTPPPSPQFLAMLALVVVVVVYDGVLLSGHLTDIDYVIRSTVFVRGSVYAQLTLLAVWSAWGPGSAFARLGSGWALTITVSISHARGIWGSNASHGQFLLSLWAFVLFWIAVQLPLWIVRVRSRYRFSTDGREEESAEHRPTQFGIAQLMMLTAFVAVSLGLIGWLVPTDFQTPVFSWDWVIATVGISIVHSCLNAWVSVWAAVSARSIWLRLVLGCSAVGILVATQSLWFHGSVARIRLELFEFFALEHGCESAAVVAVLLLARANGLRFARV